MAADPLAELWDLPWQWEIGYDPGGWGVVRAWVWNADPNDTGEFVQVARTFGNPGELGRAISEVKAAAAKIRELSKPKVADRPGGD